MIEKKMKTAITWLRASFITGAAADALVGILILIPSRMGETEFSYPMGLAASLMFGWTVLLLWGSKMPMERRGLLLITIFPVITGLAASAAWAFTAGIFSMQKIIPTVIIELSLILLMGFSYLKAGAVDRESVVNP